MGWLVGDFASRWGGAVLLCRVVGCGLVREREGAGPVTVTVMEW